jgi:hypothetical protein
VDFNADVPILNGIVLVQQLIEEERWSFEGKVPTQVELAIQMGKTTFAVLFWVAFNGNNLKQEVRDRRPPPALRSNIKRFHL